MKGREYVKTFATAYPLRSLYFQREPLTGHASTITHPGSSGFGAIATGMEQDVLTLQRILNAHMEYLPSIALPHLRIYALSVPEFSSC